MVGNATAANVLVDKTFTNASTVGATGTMPNNGAVTGSITTSGGSYTIPAGYHNGSGKVTGPTLAALVGTGVTLTSNANLLTGNTAYGKNGVKYTGSMANKGAWTNTPSTKGKVTIPAGYHNGSGYVDTTSVYNAGVAEGKSKMKLKKYSIYSYTREDRGGYTWRYYFDVSSIPDFANKVHGEDFVINSAFSQYHNAVYESHDENNLMTWSPDQYPVEGIILYVID